MSSPRKSGHDKEARGSTRKKQTDANYPRKRDCVGEGAGKSEGGSARAAPTYEVGYGKPPLHTQFRKGQARPARKPKPEVEPTFQDYFEEELRVPMKFVDETGKEQEMPKGKVLAKASVNKALKSGDIRQIKDFIPRRPAKIDNEVSKADLEIVARFFADQFGIEVTGIGIDEGAAVGANEAIDGRDDGE